MTSRSTGVTWLRSMRQRFWLILAGNYSHHALVRRAGQRLLTLSIALIVLNGAAHSQQQCCTHEEVEIGFQGLTCPFEDYKIILNDQVATGAGTQCQSIAQFPSVTGKFWTKLKVNKPYHVTAGKKLCITNINFDVPPEYVMYIDGVESNTIFKTSGGLIGTGDGIWEIVIRKRCPRVKKGGQATNQNGSVIWDVGMGNLRDGRYAEDISIREKVLSPSIYTPAALVYAPPGNTSDVDAVKNADGSLRQVKAPQAFADIVIINPSEYDIRFYEPANVGAKENGQYLVTGQPYVTWKFTNPIPGSLTKLQIAKIENGVTTDKSEYTWDAAIDWWTLNTGWSPATQTYARTETKSVSYPTQTARTETFVVKGSDGQIVSKRAETYFSFPWGEKLVQRVLDPDGAALTTTYTYFENPSEIHKYRKLKSVVFPNGSWEKYDYDIFWNISKIIRPWKDLSMAAATDSNSHVTIYGYTNSDNGVFGISEFRRIPFDIEEKINGITVRKTRYIRSIANIDPDMISVADSSYEASNNGFPVNLISQTVTTKYRFSAPAFLANRVGSVVYPDGRKDTYTYEQGNYIPNADPSLAQFVPDANGLAERQTIVHGTTASPDGIAFKTTRETVVRDQFGNHVLEEEYVYNGAGYERTGWNVMEYDNRGHLIASRNNKGESTSVVWTGERKTSEIDAAGIETVYTYDSFGRVETQTKKGVAASGGFPSQNDIVTTFSYDADGRQKTETQTGGTPSLSSSRAYDKAGRLVRETDPASLSTTYAYPNGGRTQTVSRRGGVTEVADSYLDGQVKSRTGSAIVPQYFDYGVNANGTRYEQAFTGNAGLNSPRWTKTTTDWIGRTVSIEKPSFTGTNIIESLFYNSLAQLQKKTTTANSTKLISDTLYEYDELGRQTRRGLDVDNNGSLTLASTDRISEIDSVYEKTGNEWFQVSFNKTYLIDNNSTPVVQTQRRRLNNFPSNGTEQTISESTSADVQGNVTKTTIAVDRVAKKQITTVDRPDSATNAVSISVNGLLQSSTGTTPKPATTYTYDALGRRLTTSDPSMATNVRVYDSKGRLQSMSMGSVTTTYEYYPETHVNAGRVKSETNSFNKKTYFAYNNQGQMIRTWGDATYPTEYVYDAYGQKTELHTFRGGQNWKTDQWPGTTTGTADVTKWIYQESTGLFTQKLDAAQKGSIYTYDELGRIKTRVWARGITCTYGYDSNTGELLSISYSDSTPAVSFTYDRGGRQKTATDAGGLHTRTFNALGRLETEQITGGILDGVGITVGYDSFLRRNSLQTSLGATLSNQTYGYDASSRVETVTSGSLTATYAYHPNSGLLDTTTFSDGTVISRVYDSSGRFQTITLTPDGDAPKSYTYAYNDLNQITRVTRENGSYWSYNYNDRGELLFGRKYWSDNSIVWGAQREYDFDNIGNRTSARTGGNQVGSLRQSSYSPNSLNQYSQRTVPGAVDVTGTANATAAVTVNNQAAARKTDYFYKELAIDNSSAPVSQQISVVGARNNFGAGGEDAVTEKGGRVLVPRAQESLTYDDDGNLTADGQWNYTWDAENRLVSMESVAGVPVEAKQRLEFGYDHLVRRIQKKSYLWNTSTSTFQLEATTKFVYDGWDLVAEVDGSTGLVRNYARTSTGLLFVTENNQTHAAASDSNQNIVHLVKLSTGQLSATYEYDPFGNLLQSTGEYANKNPFRFAGKYFDAETGLTYYGYRYYDSQRGRWTTRDPIGEAGGLNLYAALRNDLINRFDPDGRAERGNLDIFYQDWAGLEILNWLFQGEGSDWWIINDRKWADYMMTPADPSSDHDQFRQSEVAPKLNGIATRILDSNVPDGHSFRVDEQFSASLINGEHITGYNFLNVTNFHVGDFQIQGYGIKVMGRSTKDECQEVNFRVQYSWHDRMDYNPEYLRDIIKWAGLKMFYYQGLLRNPIPYNIHIIWSQESTYRVNHGVNKSTGWPFRKLGS